METDSQFERFEAITVRAAARLLQLEQAGVISGAETLLYARELAELDEFSSRRAGSLLVNAARRRSRIGKLGRSPGVAARRMRRRSGSLRPAAVRAASSTEDGEFVRHPAERR